MMGALRVDIPHHCPGRMMTQRHWHVKELEKEQRVLSAPDIQRAASSDEEGGRTTFSCSYHSYNDNS
jgi:hypothetical protein